MVLSALTVLPQLVKCSAYYTQKPYLYNPNIPLNLPQPLKTLHLKSKALNPEPYMPDGDGLIGFGLWDKRFGG